MDKTKKDIVARSDDIAPFILYTTLNDVDELESMVTDKEEHDYVSLSILESRDWSIVRNEFLFLYLNIVDRVVFDHLGEKERDALMDNLYRNVFREVILSKSINQDYDSGRLKKEIQRLRESLNKRIVHYSKFDKYLKEPTDETADGTLFFEFSKIIFEKIYMHKWEKSYELDTDPEEIAIHLHPYKLAANFMLSFAKIFIVKDS